MITRKMVFIYLGITSFLMLLIGGGGTYYFMKSKQKAMMEKYVNTKFLYSSCKESTKVLSYLIYAETSINKRFIDEKLQEQNYFFSTLGANKCYSNIYKIGCSKFYFDSIGRLKDFKVRGQSFKKDSFSFTTIPKF
jgi:hypothetical protein